jgi:seryl-tRNA synthetase
MLDIKILRSEPDVVRTMLTARGGDASTVDTILDLDTRWRDAVTERDRLRGERRTRSKEIGRAKDPDARQAMIAEVEGIKNAMQEAEQHERELASERDALVAALPNLLDARVPTGTGEHDNVVIETVGEPTAFDFEPKPHWELGVDLGMLDFERGVKLAGSRFYVLRDDLARLQRGLIAWLLNFHQDGGYRELYLPFVVREEVLFGAGQLPKFRENIYKDGDEDIWLVPTAEIPLTGFHSGEILEAESLPLSYTAYTPCFRREKMSHGRDVRGIKRGHQFDKVELYKLTEPDKSRAALEEMRAHVSRLCEALGLHYRVLQLCSADIGFGSQITYDFEAWAPGCQEWLEISSVSDCGDFQARRTGLRYRDPETRKPSWVHTLNGSGLGLPRTLICLMENHQQADGSIVVPEFLRPFVGKDVIRPV